jgi:hypothetical protein
LEKYGTIENYLIQEKIHFPENQDILMLPNDFPYSIEPGVEHILIWSKEALQADQVEAILDANYGRMWEWTFFINPPKYQSVKRLPHVHVFLRKIGQ